ncbi:hypothetical protein FRC08_005513 [Ceratobasidium sp. 394]|nr:hypothetical protein FRC08_005513 [Ceratobasidium sp. 394]
MLMSYDGTIKITDFGLAIMQDTVLQFSQTDPGRGTFRWMGCNAPELFKEEPQRSREVDIYAMGMTMLEIITGDFPFCDIKLDHMVYTAVVLEKRKPNVPELTQEPVSHKAGIMHHVLQWCWEYVPNERPTARQVALMVEGLVSG